MIAHNPPTQFREEPANLTGVNLRGANLRGADLTRAYLMRSILSDPRVADGGPKGAANIKLEFRAADLTLANLRGAKLHGADLAGVKIDGANLSEANLTRADLSHASLKEASLVGAYLVGTVLNHTVLTDAELTGARLASATICGVNLGKIRGLGQVEQYSPSSVDGDTLELTARSLANDHGQRACVEEFLRGAGLAQTYLGAFLDSVGQPIEFYSCFISYCHEDKAFARLIYDALQKRQVRCWLDEHQLLPGDDIYDMIDRGIRLWDKLLLCASEAALSSWWVDDEIAKALQKERLLLKEGGGKVLALIPLNLDGYMLSDEYEGGFKSTLTRRLAADFVGWEHDRGKFDLAVDQVVQALRADTRAREAPSERSR